MNASTKRTINKFRAISAIPRESGNENAIKKFLVDWAKKHGFAVIIDPAGNLLVKTGTSSVILQGHLDMVCEKSTASKHNFKNDPIKVIEENGWLKARATTLGADNGIALAYMMQLAEDGQKLELLFTVEEETGLIGATKLKKKILTGKYLINLDSEDEGIFTIGCAGGIDVEAMTSVKPIRNTQKYAYKISVNDLPGGHSGVDINKNIPNAIKVLAERLKGSDGIRIAEINGGSKRNAIPRDAFAVITSDKQLDLPEIKRPAKTLSAMQSKNIISLLLSLPHGVIDMWDKTIPKTSCNLAIINQKKNKITITSSCRSFCQEENEAFVVVIKNIFAAHGFSPQQVSGYTAWEPENKNSRLIQTALKSYGKLFKKPAKALPMHAGLECGVIKAKYPGLQAISLGPNIKNPHSPDERIEIKSIENTLRLLKDIVGTLNANV